MQEEDLFLLIFTDITIAMDRQDRLYLTDRLASVGQMASGIAHELNNPLASIVGLSELLTEEDLPDSVREDVKIINSEGLRAAGVVKNMLSFASIHTPTKQPVQMNQVIEDILKLRAYHWRINNIAVETDLDPELPNVMADYFQMQQVFLNIVLNAEQSMTESHGKGTLKITSGMVDGLVIFSFRDDGTGIAPQNIGRIFDPFFTTKEVGSGTGLGLSICYGIVTSHGGRIYARSEIGQGATFVVELPAH
jgi:signal transduction histidine kinase